MAGDDPGIRLQALCGNGNPLSLASPRTLFTLHGYLRISQQSAAGAGLDSSIGLGSECFTRTGDLCHIPRGEAQTPRGWRHDLGLLPCSRIFAAREIAVLPGHPGAMGFWGSSLLHYTSGERGCRPIAS